VDECRNLRKNMKDWDFSCELFVGRQLAAFFICVRLF
jgi:hypothetical protein